MTGRLLLLLCATTLAAGPVTVTFSTYLGIADCDDVAPAPGGDLYLGCHSPGERLPAAALPRREGASDMDGFVIRVNPRERKVVWAVRLAGRDFDAVVRVRSGPQGFVYAAGFTKSSDFPTTADALQPGYGGGAFDAFVVRIAPEGRVVYSTFVGGSGLDHGNALEVAADGTVYLGGTTASSDFPGQARPRTASRNDAFVAAFHPARPRGLRTVAFGGAGEEKLTGLALDRKGGLFAVGYTRSADFPAVQPVQPSLRGPMDLFLTRLEASTLKLVFSTWFGGSGEDSGWGIAVDRRGHPVVSGITNSGDLPDAAEGFQSGLQGGTDAFVAVFGGRGHRRVRSTYFGGAANDESGYDGGNLGIDSRGNVWLAGITMSPNLPLRHPFQARFGGGGGDGFLAALSSRLNRLCFSSYVGGADRDLLEGVTVSSDGLVTATGLSFSRDLPLPGPGVQTAESEGVATRPMNNVVFQLRAGGRCVP